MDWSNYLKDTPVMELLKAFNSKKSELEPEIYGSARKHIQVLLEMLDHRSGCSTDDWGYDSSCFYCMMSSQEKNLEQHAHIKASYFGKLIQNV